LLNNRVGIVKTRAALRAFAKRRIDAFGIAAGPARGAAQIAFPDRIAHTDKHRRESPEPLPKKLMRMDCSIKP
jgi:hypothetical protein